MKNSGTLDGNVWQAPYSQNIAADRLECYAVVHAVFEICSAHLCSVMSFLRRDEYGELFEDYGFLKRVRHSESTCLSTQTGCI